MVLANLLNRIYADCNFSVWCPLKLSFLKFRYFSFRPLHKIKSLLAVVVVVYAFAQINYGCFLFSSPEPKAKR